MQQERDLSGLRGAYAHSHYLVGSGDEILLGICDSVDCEGSVGNSAADVKAAGVLPCPAVQPEVYLQLAQGHISAHIGRNALHLRKGSLLGFRGLTLQEQAAGFPEALYRVGIDTVAQTA